MVPQEWQGQNAGTEGGFHKNSHGVHKQELLGRWPLLVVISTDAKTGLEFGGIVQGPRSPFVNLLT